MRQETVTGRGILRHRFWGEYSACVGLEFPGYWAETEANAHLIATAPSMLEALERIEDILDGSDDIAAREALTEARAALAKALGGAEGRET